MYLRMSLYLEAVHALLSLTHPQQDYLTKILFTKAHCLCHDVNAVTKSASHIDVIMGFSTGEVIWWEPISQRYTRLNKNVRTRQYLLV